MLIYNSWTIPITQQVINFPLIKGYIKNNFDLDKNFINRAFDKFRNFFEEFTENNLIMPTKEELIEISKNENTNTMFDEAN
jgi:hypothetical protein